MEYITPDKYVPGTLANIAALKRGKGNPGTKTKVVYKDVICALDIETTRLEEIEQSILYVWMLHLHHNVTIVGRTWSELNTLLDRFEEELGTETLCIYVHNLSYEFQFLRAIYNFANDEVFAVKSRKILKCKMRKCFEFRCSYLHSNSSLALYTKKWGVEHAKLSGDDFDYTKRRFPWTPLSDAEIQYCLHDVVGLCEALEKEMKSDGDNLYTVPLTSTGYVRRDAKKAMRDAPPGFVKRQLPNIEIYRMCREAFRGGDTHANRYYSGRIIRGVKSADRKSSYPEVLCNCQFPISEFFMEPEPDPDQLIDLVYVKKRATLARVAFSGIRLADPLWGAPYLSRDKCRRIELGAYDNGRILSAEYLETTLTDIDLRIVLEQYAFDDMAVMDIAHARYGKLPQSFLDAVLKYYNDKTALKGIVGMEIPYMKSKNLLNSLYGMCAQDPVKQTVLFNSGEWGESDTPEEELLSVYNSKAFLAYQWGCWVTAHARAALQEGIKIAGDNFVYCDTDSVKYIDDGTVDFSEYNAGRVAASKKSGAYATDKKGFVHYMGVYEEDGVYYEFKTLGAKKYAFSYADDPQHKTHVTIAGVTKSRGGAELDAHNGLKSFIEGFTFIEAGGTEIVYNDNPDMEISIEGHTIKITPNAVIRPSTYTLGITAEYKSLLEKSCLPLDIWANQ